MAKVDSHVVFKNIMRERDSIKLPSVNFTKTIESGEVFCIVRVQKSHLKPRTPMRTLIPLLALIAFAIQQTRASEVCKYTLKIKGLENSEATLNTVELENGLYDDTFNKVEETQLSEGEIYTEVLIHVALNPNKRLDLSKYFWGVDGAIQLSFKAKNYGTDVTFPSFTENNIAIKTTIEKNADPVKLKSKTLSANLNYLAEQFQEQCNPTCSLKQMICSF